MNVDRNLEKEVLTRLLHAHPQGLGKEVLDNYRGEKAVAGDINRVFALLQDLSVVIPVPTREICDAVKFESKCR